MVLPRRGCMVVPDRGGGADIRPGHGAVDGRRMEAVRRRHGPPDARRGHRVCGGMRSVLRSLPSQVAAAAGYTGPQPSFGGQPGAGTGAPTAPAAGIPVQGVPVQGVPLFPVLRFRGSRCRHRRRGLSGPRWCPDCPSSRRRSCRSCSCTCRPPLRWLLPPPRLQPRP